MRTESLSDRPHHASHHKGGHEHQAEEKAQQTEHADDARRAAGSPGPAKGESEERQSAGCERDQQAVGGPRHAPKSGPELAAAQVTEVNGRLDNPGHQMPRNLTRAWGNSGRVCFGVDSAAKTRASRGQGLHRQPDKSARPTWISRARTTVLHLVRV